MKKYVGIFISEHSTPHITARISQAKCWCTRHVNAEYVRAVYCKDFGNTACIVIPLDDLKSYAANNLDLSSRWHKFIASKLSELIEHYKKNGIL